VGDAGSQGIVWWCMAQGLTGRAEVRWCSPAELPQVRGVSKAAAQEIDTRLGFLGQFRRFQVEKLRRRT